MGGENTPSDTCTQTNWAKGWQIKDGEWLRRSVTARKDGFLRQKFQLKNDIINRCTKVWCNNKLANYIIIYH